MKKLIAVLLLISQSEIYGQCAYKFDTAFAKCSFAVQSNLNEGGESSSIYKGLNIYYKKKIIAKNDRLLKNFKSDTLYYNKYIKNIYLTNTSNDYNKTDYFSRDLPPTKFIFVASNDRYAVVAFAFMSNFNYYILKKKRSKWQVVGRFIGLNEEVNFSTLKESYLNAKYSIENL